jgi:antitoxin component YwqK of YwqJK toxin-antitoxin module
VADRPPTVPAEAWWSPEDNEWVSGPRDAERRLHGLIRYWRPDGSLVSECPHVAGKPHGEAKRFHDSGEVAQTATYVDGIMHGTRTYFATDARTSEKMRISRRIVRAEIDYDQGTAVAFRYFDRDGRSVGVDGTPLPPRPEGVPDRAHREPNGDWVAGAWTEGKLTGTIRRWSAKGVLLVEEHHEQHETRCTGFHDDGSPRMAFTLHGGQMDGVAEAWRRDGSLLRRATCAWGRYTVEDFDRAGTLVRKSEHLTGSVTEVVIPDDGSPAMKAIRRGDARTLEMTTELSPIAMAHMIAVGWGGDKDRDATMARVCRRLVRRVAPPSLSARLDALALDRAPRLLTARRLDQVARELSQDPAVDGEALTAALIEAGATGVALALDAPSRAAGVLRVRITEGHLNLSHLDLDRLPSAVGAFPDLLSIDASTNRLRNVPVALADLFRLQKLDLTRNILESLPRELAWLPELRTLHMAYNGLSDVPSSVFELAELSALGLADNRLTTLPEGIGDLAELQMLWLSDNPLFGLPRSITRLRKLTFLHLGNHPWSEPPAVLGELDNLEELWLTSPRLERLPPAICKLPRLRRLSLWYSSLKTLPDELFEMKQLTELRIRDNPLADGVLERIREALPGCVVY